MITRIIAAVYLLVVAGLAASIEIRGDYAGDGDFTIRGSLGGQTVATGGRNASGQEITSTALLRTMSAVQPGDYVIYNGGDPRPVLAVLSPTGVGGQIIEYEVRL